MAALKVATTAHYTVLKSDEKKVDQMVESKVVVKVDPKDTKRVVVMAVQLDEIRVVKLVALMVVLMVSCLA